MDTYRVWENKAEKVLEDKTAYEAMKAYLAAKGADKPFVLLYTEKNKMPGWEVYYKSEDMFKHPPFSFIEKLKAEKSA